jgi:polyisoprenoid-binding protein YceI
MRALVFALAAIAAAACASTDGAQAQNGGQATVAAAASAGATRYVLDPEHTQIGFSVPRFGFNNVLARFDNVSGEVTLDQAHPERSSVTATVRIADLSTGNPTRNEHVSGPRWLNAAQYPTMEFRSTWVQVTGENTATVTGDLTLLGQTHPLTLNVTLNRIGPAPSNQLASAGFTATGALSRAAWGSTTAAQLIGDTVTFTIEALGQAPAA